MIYGGYKNIAAFARISKKIYNGASIQENGSAVVRVWTKRIDCRKSQGGFLPGYFFISLFC
jgi:hypothetical protein